MFANLVRLGIAAAVAVTMGFTWTVGQSGLRQTNTNLCDLWKSLPLPPYPACEFQYILPIAWGAVLCLATVWACVELIRLVRITNRRGKMIIGYALLFGGCAVSVIGLSLIAAGDRPNPSAATAVKRTDHAAVGEPTVVFSYSDDDIFNPHSPVIEGSVDRFVVPVGIRPSKRIKNAQPYLQPFSRADVKSKKEYDLETFQYRGSPIKIGWFSESLYEARDVHVTGNKFILFEIYDLGTRLALWTNHNLAELNLLKHSIPPGEYEFTVVVIHDEMSGSPPSQKFRMKWGGTRETFTMSKLDE